MLNTSLAAARAEHASDDDSLTRLGVAYLTFARDNPALYRLMYEGCRDGEGLPRSAYALEGSAYRQLRDAMVVAGGQPADPIELELAAVAAWSATHGLAEIAGLSLLAPLKARLGSEEALLRAVFGQLGMCAQARPGSR